MKRVLAGLAIGTLLGAAAVAVADQRTDAIAERLRPVGEICMAGDECTGGATTVVAASEARDPAEIYQATCGTCHNTGVGGAPKPGDAAAWEPRLEKGMETVFENAWNGINAMPAKGICMNCTEEEMRATIDYMIEGI
ncbi:MAG: c-type cytochrome [Cellvibrionaceae bacterium]